jgi:hypothetical protein
MLLACTGVGTVAAHILLSVLLIAIYQHLSNAQLSNR